MVYRVAERFKSLQGEGLYTGTPMAFVRLVGCSVGKKICHACDTDFDECLPWRGGGEYSEQELLEWASPYEHLCLTGGEPMDQDLRPLLHACVDRIYPHIETSGTVELPSWFPSRKDTIVPAFVCVSPKPGFRDDMLQRADEIKVIVPGLGSDKQFKVETTPMQGPRSFIFSKHWPDLEDAKRWAKRFPEKPIYLQPRNGKFDIDQQNLRYVLDLLVEYPQFRLSTQEHKILKVQ